ncbi:transaldolase family protein [Streptomyces sp. NPDC051322]|uniref:transaldolase family protein n=1 Tax=Streptomyces sp. NPDC051322 TaxID=3154645 RepID=UPI00344F1AA3
MISQAAAAVLRQLVNEGVSPWLSEWACTDNEWDAARCLAEKQGFLGLFAPEAVPRPALRAACDSLRPAFDESTGRHGQVSVSLGKAISHDALALITDAAILHRSVGRPNVLVRMPATRAGLIAASACIARGFGVDVTLIFSAEHYGRVLDAYMDGLELALANGLPLEGITLLASFPVGLIDAEVNSRLADMAAGPLRDTAGIATAQLIYRAREKRLGSTWWQVLRSAGATPPRLAWTGAGPGHIGALVGSNTVMALTAAVLEQAVRDDALHGDTLLNAHSEGRRALDLLASHGIDMTDVAEVLERRNCPAGQPH